MHKNLLSTFRVVVTALLLVATHSAFADTKQDDLLSLYLLSPVTEEVKLAAKSIQANPQASQHVTDLTAEVLVTDVLGNNTLDIDTQAWLAKALGSTQQSRYRQALQTAKNASTSRKLTGYIKKSLKQLNGAEADSYLPGSLSLTMLRDRVFNQQKADSQSRTTKGSFAIRDGENLSAILSRLGLPDKAGTVMGHVNTRRIVSAWGGPSKIAVQQMLLSYNDIGEIQLARNADQWIAYFVLSYGGSGESNLPAYRQKLSVENIATLKATVGELRKSQVRVPAILDLLAERLYQSRRDENRHVAGALTHIAATLGEARNPRYLALLRLVSTEAQSSGVRK